MARNRTSVLVVFSLFPIHFSSCFMVLLSEVEQIHVGSCVYAARSSLFSPKSERLYSVSRIYPLDFPFRHVRNFSSRDPEMPSSLSYILFSCPMESLTRSSYMMIGKIRLIRPILPVGECFLEHIGRLSHPVIAHITGNELHH